LPTEIEKENQDIRIPKIWKKLLDSNVPFCVSGRIEVPHSRNIIWKSICQISDREMIVEFSVNSTKFFIVALDLKLHLYYVIELWKLQANKIIMACGNKLENLI